MEKAGHECLPVNKLSNKSRKANIPGWNDQIKPYADDCKFWNQVWLAAGKPVEGELYTNMRVSRRQFKFAVRRLKRCQEKVQNEKFLQCVMANDGDVFQEMKKLRGCWIIKFTKNYTKILSH